MHRFSKTRQLSIRLIVGHGAEGDVHAGAFVRHRYLARQDPHAPNLRQLHLISDELLQEVRAADFDVQAGDLGENITTQGLDLEALPLGTELRFDSGARIELTGLRTPCVLIDRFRNGLKRRMLGDVVGPAYRAGVMSVVSSGGQVKAGDRIEVILPSKPHRALPPL